MLRLGKAVLCAAFYFAVAAVLIGQPAFAQGKEVRVYNWSDYIDPTILRGLHQGNRHQGRLRRLRQQRDPRDQAARRRHAATTSSCRRLRSCRARSRPACSRSSTSPSCPTSPTCGPRSMSALAKYDPGNEYAINYMWGTTGIGYNVDKVKERLPDAPVDSLGHALQARDRREAHGLRHQRARRAGRHRSGGAQLSRPRSRQPRTRTTSKKADELLTKIRPYIRKFHSSEYINALANGDICLALGWSGDILQAAQPRRRKPRTGRSINYRHPEGRRADVVRHDGDPGRRQERRRGPRLPQLPDASRR